MAVRLLASGGLALRPVCLHACRRRLPLFRGPAARARFSRRGVRSACTPLQDEGDGKLLGIEAVAQVREGTEEQLEFVGQFAQSRLGAAFCQFIEMSVP